MKVVPLCPSKRWVSLLWALSAYLEWVSCLPLPLCSRILLSRRVADRNWKQVQRKAIEAVRPNWRVARWMRSCHNCLSSMSPMTRVVCSLRTRPVRSLRTRKMLRSTWSRWVEEVLVGWKWNLHPLMKFIILSSQRQQNHQYTKAQHAPVIQQQITNL